MVRDGAPAIELHGPIAGIMVATPMYGGQCFDAWALGVFDLQRACHQHGIPLAIQTIRNESLIQRARNRLVAEFLASEMSHLVFIDADIGFSGRDVLRLVAHNKPIIGATYAKKNREREDFAIVPLGRPVEVEEGDVFEVEALPGGFMCIQRATVVQMVHRYAHLRYRVQGSDVKGAPFEQFLFSLFDCAIDPATLNYWSEDYLFCKRWYDMGGRIMLDPHIILEHHGSTKFTGDPDRAFGVVGRVEPADVSTFSAVA